MSHGQPKYRRKPAKRERQRPEHDEQQRIKRDLTACGFDYYDTSQPFRALITPGVPDLFVAGVVPSMSGAGHYEFMVAVETKAPGTGVQSRPQKLFQRRWQNAGHVYIMGGRKEVRAWMVRIGAAFIHGQSGEWTVAAGILRMNRERAQAERAAGLRAEDE